MNPILRKILTSNSLRISVAAGLFYTLAGFFVAPAVIKWYAPKYAQQNLQCHAGIEKIRINPFWLTIELNGFRLDQADGLPLAAFDKLFLDLETVSLFKWAIVLKELNLENPKLHVILEPDGSVNLAKLAGPPSQETEPMPSENNPLPFIVHDLAIRNGQIAIIDKRQSTPADFTLRKLALQGQEISTLKGHHGSYHLSATAKDEETIQMEGDLSLFPLHSKGRIGINSFRLAGLWEFMRDSTNLEQPAGLITLSTGYQINTETTSVQMSLEELRVVVSALSLQRINTEMPFCRLEKVDLTAPRFDVTGNSLHISHLLLEDGDMDIRVDESGELNLSGIIRTTSPENPPAADPQPPSNPAIPFKVQADAIDCKDIALNLHDQSRKNPIRAAIAGADLHLQVTLETGADANSMVLQDMASELRGLSLHGFSSQEPLLAAQKLTIEDGRCDVSAQALSFARIAISQGRLEAGRDEQGAINWQQLLLPKESTAQSEPAEPLPDTASPWTYLINTLEVDGFALRFADLTTRSIKPIFSLQGFNARLKGIDGKSPMDFALQFQVEQGGTASVKGTVNPTIPSVAADLDVKDIDLNSLQPYLEPHVTLKLQSAAASAQGNLRYGIPGDKQKAIYEGDFNLEKLLLINTSTKKPYLSWGGMRFSKCSLTLEPNNLNVQEISFSKPSGELIIEKDKGLNLTKVLKNKPDGNKTMASAPPAAKNQQSRGKQDVFAYQIAKVLVKDGDLVFADFNLKPSFKTRIHGLKGSVTGLTSAPEAQAKIKMDGQVDKYGTAKINGTIRPVDFASLSDISMVFRNVEMKNLSSYSGKFAGRLIESGKLSADLQYTLQDYKMIGENKIVIDNLFLGEQVDNPDASDLPLNLALALLKDANGRIDIGLPVTGDLNDPQFSIGPLIWKMFTNLILKTAAAPFQALGNLLGNNTENISAIPFEPGSATLPPPEKEKLLKLSDALKNRPQLKLVIQGRYSPDIDGLELRERSLRKTVHVRLGATPETGDIPELLDFDDSKTQNTLERLYEERFGKTSLDELEQGLTTGAIPPKPSPQNRKGKSREAGMFSKMADSLQLHKFVPGVKSHEQAVGWAEELYSRLTEGEKMADKILLELANARAQAIATSLESETQIAKERLSINPPEPLSDGEQPSVTLALDAL